MTKINAVVFEEQRSINMGQVEEGNQAPERGYIQLEFAGIPSLLALLKGYREGSLPTPVATLKGLKVGDVVMGLCPITFAEKVEMNYYGDVEDSLTYNREKNDVLMSWGIGEVNGEDSFVVTIGAVKNMHEVKELAESGEVEGRLADGAVFSNDQLDALIAKVEELEKTYC